MNNLRSSRRTQAGAFLLEALIAILIFSFGVLGIVGLQARSLKAVGDAQYRGEAAYYAETLAGRMWAHDPADVTTYFGTGGAGFVAWSAQVTAAGTGLPRASVKPPEINIAPLNSANGLMATVTIYWQAPGDEKDCTVANPEKCFHQYITSVVIGSNVAA